MTKAPEGNIYKSQQRSTYSFLFLTFFLSRCVCRCTCVRTCNPGVLYSAEVLGEECWESSHHTEASLDRKSPASPHCRSVMSYNLTLDNPAFPGFMQMTKTCSPISLSHSLSLSVFFSLKQASGISERSLSLSTNMIFGIDSWKIVKCLTKKTPLLRKSIMFNDRLTMSSAGSRAYLTLLTLKIEIYL